MFLLVWADLQMYQKRFFLTSFFGGEFSFFVEPLFSIDVHFSDCVTYCSWFIIFIFFFFAGSFICFSVPNFPRFALLVQHFPLFFFWPSSALLLMDCRTSRKRKKKNSAVQTVMVCVCTNMCMYICTNRNRERYRYFFLHEASSENGCHSSSGLSYIAAFFSCEGSGHTPHARPPLLSLYSCWHYLLSPHHSYLSHSYDSHFAPYDGGPHRLLFVHHQYHCCCCYCCCCYLHCCFLQTVFFCGIHNSSYWRVDTGCLRRLLPTQRECLLPVGSDVRVLLH